MMEAELEGKIYRFFPENIKLKKIDLVILVDDNPTDIFINKRVIAHSYLANNVVAYKNGKEALEFLEENRSRINNKSIMILLDFSMPYYDGIDFIKEFEKMFAFSKITVVLLTALDNPDYLVKLKSLGKYDVLTKPLTIENFETLHHKFFKNSLIIKTGKNKYEICLFL